MVQRGKTGDGYIYYRDRSRGYDVTVYEHQLMALLDHSATDVFADSTDVHHVAPTRDANVPGLLIVVESKNHRTNALNGWTDHRTLERRPPDRDLGQPPPIHILDCLPWYALDMEDD